MSSEVSNLLPATRVVECDYPRIAGGSEVGICWAEFDGSHGFNEAGDAVGEFLGSVVEDEDLAVLVTRGC